ncbi:hypothetical protein PYW07_008167 [Mythimna separata]|uniref:Zinc finger PHD-type domain-containing protein n=1 Tax=Mythimna separata TaxID=271217 RepID=A0AAD8DUM6_MYTSE|nr:hypothetical protein PYW07_008167 [Mythimna separata]
MVKCAKCVKLITKKSPGLQCGKCSKWLHGSCASITPDQLSVLSDTDSVDWKCKVCAGGSKPKRVSCIIPDLDGDENTDTESVTPHNSVHADNTMRQILQDLRREVKQIIKEELQCTLQYYSDKIDEYEIKVQKYEKSMKELENRCSDLQNHQKNINIKYEVLENKINQMEQAQLCNQLEICGINPSEKYNPVEIAKKVAIALAQNPDDIVNAYRRVKKSSTAATKKDQTPVTVILREGNRDSWLDATKKTTLSAADMELGDDIKVYLRESLTPSTAYLLWKTKEELKESFKFIWCKHGNILVRKSEQEKKITTIRSISDIEKVKSSPVGQ